MKTNIIYKVLFLIIFMVATIFMTRPVYAFTIETLDDSLDYNEIQNKEDEILDVVCNFIEVEKNNLIVDYSRAVKVYVDTNIFAYERLSTDVIRSLLDNAVYFWEVPVKVSDGEYVICTVSKVPPISEEIKQDLLDAQIFTEDEIIEEESKVGQWEIPTWAESQNQTDYIGNIETYIGETFNPDDEKQLYLLGGTPNIRQPFGLIEINGDYTILALDPLVSEGVASNSDSNTSTYSANTPVFSFDQVKNWITTLPPESGDDSDTGYLNDGNKVSSISEHSNSNKPSVCLVATLIVISSGFILLLYLKRKQSKK